MITSTATHMNATFSAVLVLTDLSSITTRLTIDEPCWRPMAIRYEETKEIDQIAFFDREANAITHVAILDSNEPWVPVYVTGKPVTFLPNIVDVMDCIDGPAIDSIELKSLAALGVLPEHNIEGVLIEDMDEVLNDEDALPSILQDQFILNRRNINTVGALKYLLTEGLDLMALAEEWAEVELDPSSGLPMEKLPTMWAKGSEEDQQKLLALLNSAFAE